MELLILAGLLGAVLVFDLSGVFESDPDSNDENSDGEMQNFSEGDHWTGPDDDVVNASNTATVHTGGGLDNASAWGTSRVNAGDGNDVLTAHHNSDVFGEDGNDLITAYNQSNANGDLGNDTISGHDKSKSWGNQGNDLMAGEDLAVIYGGAGNDTMLAGGASKAYGGAGADSLSVGTDATGYGDDGNDVLVSRGDAFGGAGNDLIELDYLKGNVANAYGGAGDDTLIGAASSTAATSGTVLGTTTNGLYGGTGKDILIGHDGEIMDGGSGNDVIIAKDGGSNGATSTVTLGGGSDLFAMSYATLDGGKFNVADYNPTSDKLGIIVKETDAATLSYTITPNVAGNYTELTLSLPTAGTAEKMIYRFDGVTTLDPANISLFADEAAAAKGTSYRALV